MVNKKLITILAGAAVSIPALGSAQDAYIQLVRGAAVVTSGGQSVAHTVQRGENLWRIARDHGFTEQELMDFNRLPNSVIRPGQVLRMPVRGLPHPVADSVAPVARPATPASMAGTYKVKGGDVLSRIAKAHGVSTQALMSANGISDATKLRIGQTLKVPGGGVASAPVATPSQPKVVATHTVRPGDTLFRIASQHKISIAQIKAANNLTSERLQPGQDLAIPGSSSHGHTGSAVPVKALNPVQPKVSDLGSYTVQKGDTFSKIARNFGTTANELIRINEITNPNILIPGQTMLVPGGTQAITTNTPRTAPDVTGASNIPGGAPANVAATGIDSSSAALPAPTPAEIAPPILPVRSGGVQDYAGYTIVPGDTLDTIAQTFATTKSELMRLNKLSSPDEVKSGDQILVPTYGIYNDLGGPY